MSQGITIYNATGKVQIDENYSNYAIYQKGSSWVPSRGHVTVYFNPVGGLIPMIYLRAMESGATFAIESVTSSSFVLVNHAYPSRGIVVDWFTCFPISALGPSGDAYGFRVFKPNGTPRPDCCAPRSRRLRPRKRSRRLFGDVDSEHS